MSSFTSDARFFGLDLKQLGRHLREPWEGASTWPIASWLSPSVSVRVLLADGRDVLWVDGKGAFGSPAAASAKSIDGTGFVAIEPPEDLVLRRSVQLPAMGAADRISALALEARSASPFATTDLVWGASPSAAHSGGHTLVLASRKHLLAYQNTLGARVPSGASPEIWAFDATGVPIVLTGFGEQRRMAFIARWRRTASVLLGTAAVIAVGIAVTPSIKLKLRANQAHAAYTTLAQSAAPALKSREALVKSAEQLTALQALLSERIEPLRLLDALTRVIPDDAALQSLRLAGTKVTLTGYAANASSLMQVLGSQPGMRAVRAPSPATRLTGAEKESFVIEFMADPAHFGVVGGPPILAAAPPPAPTAPLPVQPTPATPAPVAAPQGGGAVFGGTAPKPSNPAPASSAEKGAKP